MSDLFDLVVIEVKENETRQRHQVFDLGNVVMLQVQQAEALLSFQQGHVWELALVEVQSLGVHVTLRGLPIDHEDSWNLWQFGKDDLVFVLHSTHDSVLQEVAISLILLVLGKLYAKVSSESALL